jgi:hypothetical protein
MSGIGILGYLEIENIAVPTRFLSILGNLIKRDRYKGEETN